VSFVSENNVSRETITLLNQVAVRGGITEMISLKIDLEPFFKKYEELVEIVDVIFSRVKEECGDLVCCKTGCSDCCNALFDLTLIEAVYINHRFNEKFSSKDREEIFEKANRADRKTYKIKREAFKMHEKGENEARVLASVGAERVRCPLLNMEELCDLYSYRPITCRLYGIPTAIQGMGHTCGKSGFKKGEQYSTVNMDKIYSKLYQISSELVAVIKTNHPKMADILMPVSMALLTDFNNEYLGIIEEDDKKESNNG